MIRHLTVEIVLACAVFCLLKKIRAEGPLMCYQCNSAFDEKCANLKANDTGSLHYKPCTIQNSMDEQPLCRKIYQKIFARDGLVRIVRSCGYIAHPEGKDCYTVKNEDHEEIVCQCFDDGCNSAPRSTSTVILSVTSAITLSTFSIKYLHL